MHSRKRRLRLAVKSLLIGLAITAALAIDRPLAHALQGGETDVPPGNPVVGSERLGDVGGAGETNYALWALVAVCLIGAGVLLVKIERWEARRIRHAEL